MGLSFSSLGWGCPPFLVFVGAAFSQEARPTPTPRGKEEEQRNGSIDPKGGGDSRTTHREEKSTAQTAREGPDLSEGWRCGPASRTRAGSVSRVTSTQTFSCSPDNCCQFGFATAQDQNSHCFGPRFHTVDFLVEIHPANFASPNTSILLSNWVHGYLQVIRGYLIVYRATLLRAVRSCVRGEAIFRINSFTEYKRSGLSVARKLNLAATLWSSFNSFPVRRSSSSLTSSEGSCLLPFCAVH